MDTMMKGEDSEEVEIDLDSSEPEEFENGEDPEILWKAHPALEEEENIHTSTLVEISDTKPLLNVRDPRGINDCLKVLHAFSIEPWSCAIKRSNHNSLAISPSYGYTVCLYP